MGFSGTRSIDAAAFDSAADHDIACARDFADVIVHASADATAPGDSWDRFIYASASASDSVHACATAYVNERE